MVTIAESGEEFGTGTSVTVSNGPGSVSGDRVTVFVGAGASITSWSSGWQKLNNTEQSGTGANGAVFSRIVPSTHVYSLTVTFASSTPYHAAWFRTEGLHGARGLASGHDAVGDPTTAATAVFTTDTDAENKVIHYAFVRNPDAPPTLDFETPEFSHTGGDYIATTWIGDADPYVRMGLPNRTGHYRVSAVLYNYDPGPLETEDTYTDETSSASLIGGADTVIYELVDVSGTGPASSATAVELLEDVNDGIGTYTNSMPHPVPMGNGVTTYHTEYESDPDHYIQKAQLASHAHGLSAWDCTLWKWSPTGIPFPSGAVGWVWPEGDLTDHEQRKSTIVGLSVDMEFASDNLDTSTHPDTPVTAWTQEFRATSATYNSDVDPEETPVEGGTTFDKALVAWPGVGTGELVATVDGDDTGITDLDLTAQLDGQGRVALHTRVTGGLVAPANMGAAAGISFGHTFTSYGTFTFQPPPFKWLYDNEGPLGETFMLPTAVLRQYPRDDARGVGGVARVWPPPRRRRIIGRQP